MLKDQIPYGEAEMEKIMQLLKLLNDKVIAAVRNGDDILISAVIPDRDAQAPMQIATFRFRQIAIFGFRQKDYNMLEVFRQLCESINNKIVDSEGIQSDKVESGKITVAEDAILKTHEKIRKVIKKDDKKIKRAKIDTNKDGSIEIIF